MRSGHPLSVSYVLPALAKRPSKGFTLLELLVVLTIAALAAGLVGPSFVKLLDTVQFQQQSRTLQNVLRKSHLRAQRQGQTQQLNISAHQLTQGENVLFDGGHEAQLEVLNERGLPSSNQQLQFFSNGSSSGGVLVFSQAHRQQLYQIHWLTGAVMNVSTQGLSK